MAEGWHEIIEPDELLPLMVNRHNFVLAAAILTWLEVRIKAATDLEARGIEIGVIGAGMAGYYPALGIRLRDHSNIASTAANEFITGIARNLLQHAPLLDFIQFAETSSIDWEDLTSDLIRRQTEQRKE